MPVYVVVLYYALPWCLVAIVAVAIVRLVLARRRGGETWRELVVMNRWLLWYDAMGIEGLRSARRGRTDRFRI